MIKGSFLLLSLTSDQRPVLCCDSDVFLLVGLRAAESALRAGEEVEFEASNDVRRSSF